MRRLYRETYQPALVITTTASTPVGLTIDLRPYTQPVWIDWGDGVQKIVTGGLLSHTYATQAARVLRLVPLTSRPLGDTLIVSTGSRQGGIGLPVATIPRSITRILNLYQCSGVTGNVADLPRVTYYLGLSGVSQLTGNVADLPRVTYILNLSGVSKLTGNVADLPRVTNTLNLSGLSQLTGNVADLPRVTYYLNLDGVSKLTGNVADLPRVTNTLNLNGCSGIGYAANYFGQYGGTYRPSTLTLSSMGWNQASVDATLADLVAATSAAPGWTTCTLNLSGNAAPSAQGLADRDILVSRGWTVTVAA